jgi:uncharacterized membrane protein
MALGPQAGSMSTAARPRLDSLDLLRGLVIVLMALDHSRDFMTNVPFDPLDASRTSVLLYFTRWITHFCAPVFILLAGTSAFLYQQRGRSRGEVSRFLLSRGLWLCVLNFTVIWFFGWTWSFHIDGIQAGVIWVIGASMIVLAGALWLPRRALWIFALGQIFAHNLLDGVTPGTFGNWAWLWSTLHVMGGIKVGSITVGMVYPLVPWVGVMTLGYLLGPLMLATPDVRRRWLLAIGFGAIALFFLLRGTNIYGDLRTWSAQETPLQTAMVLFNVQKYPPSLDYLLITLGPALLALVAFNGWSARTAQDKATRSFAQSLRNALLVFGRVPLFFYVLHLPLYHALTWLLHVMTGRETDWLFGLFTAPEKSASAAPDRGFGLLVVYVMWLAGLAILFPLCRWFAALKQRRRDAWLSYL